MSLFSSIYNFVNTQKNRKYVAQEYLNHPKISYADSRKSLADQYANTRFADVFASNPYLDYKPGLIDQFGDFFGFGTTADEYEKAAREYDAQIAQLQSEDEYNDPAAMAARERAAGLNPDLTGTGAAEASEFAQEQTSPGALEGLNQLQNFGSMILNVFGSVMGFAKDTEALKQLRNSTESGDIQNARDMLSFANDLVTSLSSQGQYGPEVDARTANTAKEWYSETFHGRRAKDRFSLGIASALNDIRNKEKWYAASSSIEGSRKDIASARASQYYSVEDSLYSAMIKPYVNLVERYNSQVFHNKSQYEDVYDPNLAASAENASNKSGEARFNMEYDLNSTMRKIVSNLAKAADKGDTKASIAVLLFSVLSSAVPKLGIK